MRIPREVVEDDLGVESISEDEFRGWIEAQLERLEGAVLFKSLSKVGWIEGEDRTFVISRSDFDDETDDG